MTEHERSSINKTIALANVIAKYYHVDSENVRLKTMLLEKLIADADGQLPLIAISELNGSKEFKRILYKMNKTVNAVLLDLSSNKLSITSLSDAIICSCMHNFSSIRHHYKNIHNVEELRMLGFLPSTYLKFETIMSKGKPKRVGITITDLQVPLYMHKAIPEDAEILDLYGIRIDKPYLRYTTFGEDDYWTGYCVPTPNKNLEVNNVTEL